jgi:nitrogen regulatory protein PII
MSHNTTKENKDSKMEDSSLPFESSDQTPRSSPTAARGQEQLSGSKKRIEAIISSEKLDAVLGALGSLELAATYYDSKGKGKGEKHTISYGRGVGRSKMTYSDRKTIVIIVEEHSVGDVIATIRSAATGSGTISAGIIVISSVDSIIQI